MLKRFLAVLAAITIGFTGAAIVATPAQAAPSAFVVNTAIAQIASFKGDGTVPPTVTVREVKQTGVSAQLWAGCPAPYYCFWWNASAGGTRYDFNVTIGSADSVCITVGQPVRSNASSYANRKVNTHSYVWGSGSGTCNPFFQFYLGPQYHPGDRNFGGTPLNDQIWNLEAVWNYPV